MAPQHSYLISGTEHMRHSPRGLEFLTFQTSVPLPSHICILITGLTWQRYDMRLCTATKWEVMRAAFL